jgi:hypothetical protein
VREFINQRTKDGKEMMTLLFLFKFLSAVWLPRLNRGRDQYRRLARFSLGAFVWGLPSQKDPVWRFPRPSVWASFLSPILDGSSRSYPKNTSEIQLRKWAFDYWMKCAGGQNPEQCL